MKPALSIVIPAPAPTRVDALPCLQPDKRLPRAYR
jgi:hypothetical protein